MGVGVQREAPTDEDGEGPPPQRRRRSADRQEGLIYPLIDYVVRFLNVPAAVIKVAVVKAVVTACTSAVEFFFS